MVRASDNPKQLARQAKLRHILDEVPGILRKRQGRGFRYEYSNGKPVVAETQLERIRSLAIPPAWSDVWICKVAQGHLQATGRDDANRKQYLYHEQWHEKVTEVKFDYLLEFGKLLPSLRSKVQAAMRKRSSTSQQILALLVRILDETGIRIGNESYTRENGSFGLTTLLGKHLSFEHGSAALKFPGKSNQQQHLIINEPQIVRSLKKLKRTANAQLFGYEDEQQFHRIDANEVNAFLKELTGKDFTAKDFRTWVASARLASELYAAPMAETQTEIRSTVKHAITQVADYLGHTPTICKRYYIHPGVVSAYEEGRYQALTESFHKRKRKWLRAEDQLLIHILKKL